MKNKLLHIILILTMTCVLQFIMNPAVIALFHKPAPLKIAPLIQNKDSFPCTRNKYTPAELRRIYFHEHVHQSIKRGIKGKVN